MTGGNLFSAQNVRLYTLKVLTRVRLLFFNPEVRTSPRLKWNRHVYSTYLQLPNSQ